MNYLSLILAVCVFYAPVLAVDTRYYFRRPTVSAPSFTANAAVFNGTTNYVRMEGDSTGMGDTTGMTVSFWVKFNAINKAQYICSHATAGAVEYFACYVNASNTWRFRASSNGTVGSAADLTSSITFTTGTWYHVLWTVKTSSSSDTKLVVNGVEDTSLVETTLTGTIDLTVTGKRNTIGGSPSGTPASLLDGTVAEVWANDSWLDPTTNLSKFYNAGNPVSLGTNGETPTGASPFFYFSSNGQGTSWATNTGTVTGTWTVGGTTLGNATLP